MSQAERPPAKMQSGQQSGWRVCLCDRFLRGGALRPAPPPAGGRRRHLLPLPPFPNRTRSAVTVKAAAPSSHPSLRGLGTLWRQIELSFQCRPLSEMAGVTQECRLCRPVTQLLVGNGKRCRWGPGTGQMGSWSVQRGVWSGRHRARVQREVVLEPLSMPPTLT